MNDKNEEEVRFAFLKTDFEFDYFRIYTECEKLPNECEEALFYHGFFLGDLASFFTIYKHTSLKNKFYIKVFDRIFEIELKSFNKNDIINNLKNIQKTNFIYPETKRDYTDYRYIYTLFSNQVKPLQDSGNDILSIISHTFRGSDTLDKTEKNYMCTKSIEILIDTRGVYCDSKYPLQRLRIIMIYCLLVYYILTTKQYIKRLALYDDLKDIIKIRKELLEYDVRYFYKNPISQSRHELYAIYELMAKNHNLINLYEEMKTQTKDLAKIVEIELNERKAKQYKWVRICVYTTTTIVTLMGIFPALESAIKIFPPLKIIIDFFTK